MAVLLPDWALRRALVLRWPWRPDIWPNAGRAAQQALLALLERLQGPLLQRQIQLQLEVPSGLDCVQLNTLNSTVETVITPYADIWVRDCAPFYVANNIVPPAPPFAETQQQINVTSYCAGFNGWAGLDPDFARDVQARAHLCERFALRCADLPLVLEGGSVQTNGEGVLVYVASAVLDARRNPELTQAQFEDILYTQFGAQLVIALEHGLSADETGGHADNLVTFLSPSQVLVSAPDDPSHPEYALGEQVCGQLQRAFAADLRPLQILRTPLPQLYLEQAQAAAIERREDSKERFAGMPLCATYTNGIRIDDIYVLPQFGVAQDAEVFQMLQNECPQLHIIPADSRALLAGGGGWHCASHAVV